MKKKKIPSVIPIYAAAGAWLLYALLFPLYKLWHFLLCGGLTIGIYIILKMIYPGKVIEEPIPQKPETTGNPELDKVIAQGRDSIEQMKALDEKIEDPVISGQIQELERLTGKIFAAVQEKPKKISEIKSFMNYYIPTTLKLLASYEKLVNQGQAGVNIEDTKKNIENIMETIVTAYRNLLDSLFAAEAMDIKAEISVLETMMAKDGLKKSKDFE